jgi:SAM-dependent methyltransferase
MSAEDGFQVIDTHAVMLLDRPRVEAFARAIREVVRPGDVVADIGSGTGILAAIAAQAGASRVFAVERGPLIELAREIVRENGLEGRVELIHGDALDIELPEPPDVIVSETLGSFGVDEDIVGLMGALRAKAKPDVRLVPEALQVVLAPLHDRTWAARVGALRDLEGVRMGSFVDRLRHRVSRHRIVSDDVAGSPEGTGWIELGRDVLPAEFVAETTLERDGEVNAIGAWFESRLSPSVILATGPKDPLTHWSPLVLPLEPPLSCAGGGPIRLEVRPRVTAGRALWAWRASSGDEARSGDTMLSAAGGAGDLLAQLGLGRRSPESS